MVMIVLPIAKRSGPSTNRTTPLATPRQLITMKVLVIHVPEPQVQVVVVVKDQLLLLILIQHVPLLVMI